MNRSLDVNYWKAPVAKGGGCLATKPNASKLIKQDPAGAKMQDRQVKIATCSFETFTVV